MSLGAGLVKVRVAREGEGKSGGFRFFLAVKRENWAIFLFGFAKSRRENLSRADQEVYKDAARELLLLSDEQLAMLIDAGEFEEINQDYELCTWR